MTVYVIVQLKMTDRAAAFAPMAAKKQARSNASLLSISNEIAPKPSHQ